MSIPKINIAEALRGMLGERVLCGSTHLNTKEQYESLAWADSRPKPTWKELTAWWNTNIVILREAAEREAAIIAEIDRYNRAEARKRLGLSAEGG